MIVNDDPEWLIVDFCDWSSTMMALAYVLAKLPADPDMRPGLIHSYPIGIERLRAAAGDESVRALYVSRVVHELEYRPAFDEIVELGNRVLKAQRELESVVVAHVRS
jgi:hypothetical protein